MKEEKEIPEFLLLGGALHRLGCRLGLVKDGRNTLTFGIVLGFLTWGILTLLVFLQGAEFKFFSLGLIAAHIRFLVAIPLFFLCETWVVPRMTEFVRNIVRAGIVADPDLPRLAAETRRFTRLKDSWHAEAVFILAVLLIPVSEIFTPISHTTASWAGVLALGGGKLTAAKIWYMAFCLPLFRFLMLLWFWRLGLWFCFLWRLEKLKLDLIPTHPDTVGGLGFLEIVQEHFNPLILAFSAILAASFAEDIFSGTMPFEALQHMVPLVLLFQAALFITPLFIFSHKLFLCRSNGWNDYMVMASRYVEAFHRKWILEEKSGEEALGTGDIQSLADLNNSVNIVREMRWIPASRRLFTEMAVCALAPFVPLVFMKYPVDQLLLRLFEKMAG